MLCCIQPETAVLIIKKIIHFFNEGLHAVLLKVCFKSAVGQIEKTLINDDLSVSKVS